MIVPKFFSSIASALPFLLVSSVVVVVPSRGQATGGTCSGVKEIIYNGECATQNPLYSNVCVFGEGGVSIVLRNGFGQDNVFSSCCPLEEAFARIPNPGTGGVTVVDPANPPVCAPGTDFEALLPFACEDIALSGSTPPPPRPDRACLVCSATTVPTVCDQLRSVSGGTQPLTNANIQAAVSAYIAGDPTVRSLYGDPINAWDVSLVTDMAGLFENQGGFNEPLECWDVSSVTNMDNMFSSTMGFMQPLDSWNVSAVTSMWKMFYSASSFNQPLDSWNVAAVTDMDNMFGFADVFNQPLNNWNVAAVTSMRDMFFEASEFNQPLNNWNVAAVTDMNGMFNGATSFNQPLNNWNVGAVTDMALMFSFALVFNQPLDNWDVSKVVDFDQMFFDMFFFNQDLCSWGSKIKSNPNPVSVSSMFSATDCPNEADPNIALTDPTPLCFNCV